eukprot:m.147935 g.147935  ORF g.147935 m.147935 type:complete len:370 (+) comp13246_c2_seq2:168-1277(+)
MPFKLTASLRRKKKSKKKDDDDNDNEDDAMGESQLKRTHTKKKGVLSKKFSFRRYTSETKFQPMTKLPEEEDETPNVSFNVGMVTTIGDHPKNEDRATIIEDLFEECPPTCGKEYNGTDNTKVSMFCVYDGHGGHDASEFANTNVQQHMSNFLWTSNFHSAIPDALHHSFKNVEDVFCTWAKRNNNTSGSCATCVIVKGNTVYCGNAGDSQALLVLPSGSKEYTRVVLNDRHGTSLPSERLRVKKAGGKISADGAVYGILFPTRGFGDIDVKAAKKNVIICTPNGAGMDDVPAVTLNTTQTATLVVASDGLWDFVSDRSVQNIVISSQSPQDAAHLLHDEARQQGSDDDVTVVVVSIEFPHASLKTVHE